MLITKKRNIILYIGLTILTGGFFLLFWFYTINLDLFRISNNPKFKASTNLLLTIVTLGLYLFYWNYIVTKELCEINSYFNIKGILDNNQNLNFIIYTLLLFLGLPFVTIILIQNNLNKLIK